MKTEKEKREWGQYQRGRRAIGLTMLLTDELKQRVVEAAAAEKRTLNNWCQEHLLDYIESEVAKYELARKAPPAPAKALTAEDVLALIRQAGLSPTVADMEGADSARRRKK